MYFVAYNSSTTPLACLHRLLHLRSLATNLKPNPKMWIPSVMSCCSHGPYNSLLMKVLIYISPFCFCSRFASLLRAVKNENVTLEGERKARRKPKPSCFKAKGGEAR